MSIYGDLRQRYPFLTPPFVGENEQPQRPKIRVAFGNKGLTGVEEPKPAIKLPVPTETTALPERNPYEGYTPTATPPAMPNIRIGSPVGLSGIDKSIGDLDAQRQAAIDFPSSRVRNGEILPPKMHHGFKDRLKSIGLGALQGLQYGPGGAIAGAITGGVSPVTIDKIQARRALARKTAEVGQQIDIETGRAKLEDLRMRPALEAAKIQAEADYRHAQQDIQRQLEEGRISRAEAQRQLEEIKATETARHNRELERLGQARIDKPPSTQLDRVGARQEAARQRKYDAAQRELATHIEGEKAAATEKDKAYAEYGNLQAQYARQTDDDARAALKPQLDAAKDRAEKAQAYYASFAEKKTKAQTAIDENAPAAEAAPNYQGRTMSQANLARYAKDKGLSEADARKQLEGMGITIR